MLHPVSIPIDARSDRGRTDVTGTAGRDGKHAVGLRSTASLRLVGPLVLAAVGCGVGADEATDLDTRVNGTNPRPLVVCTTAMIGDLATEIAGAALDVEVLFGPNVDPHLFRPARDDVALLLRADLVVYNGHALEGYLVETLERVEAKGTDLIALAEVILEPGEEIAKAGAVDPHVWMDPSIWQRGCDRLADAFAQELTDADGDPTASSQAVDGVRARANEQAARLRDMDDAFAGELATIPEGSRVLVTAHDAFGYFGRRYGIEVLAIQGFSTASEAGLLAIEDLVDQLTDRRIPAVFFESSVSERNVRALIEGAASRGHAVSLGGVLHSDAPGAARTYEAMIRHNVGTIVEALRGDSTARAAELDPASPSASASASASGRSSEEVGR